MNIYQIKYILIDGDFDAPIILPPMEDKREVAIRLSHLIVRDDVKDIRVIETRDITKEFI